MSLETLYARDIDANYRRAVSANRPAPETSFSLWGALGAGFSGIPGGLLEVAGSGADILAPAQRQVQRRPRPVVLRDQPAPRFDQVSGDVFRSKAAEFAPDPQTAHIADQALYGIGRFGTKAAAAMMAAGPVAGAALLGAEETNTQYRGLLEKGVDPDTALLTGMTLGAAGAVGVALPISGAGMATTLRGQIAATTGLVAVGGPGLYMAQEELARQILGSAGYDAEAATHDPTDPLGLALSTILPGGFGAWSLRNAARQARLAKMAVPKTEAQLREAAALNPEEQAASDAFERSEANLAQLREAIKAEKNPENRAILEAELAQQEAAARAAARDPVQPADPDTMDAARAVQVERALTNNLPDMPNARAMVLDALDEVAAGRFPEIPAAITREQREANFAAWFGESKVVDTEGKPLVVYHGTASDFDYFQTGRNKSAGESGLFFAVDRAIANRYTGWDPEGNFHSPDIGSVMPVYLSAKNPLVVDFAGGKNGRTEAISRAIQEGRDSVLLKNHYDAGGVQDQWVVFRPEQIKSAIGNSGRFDPTSGSLTDPMPDARVAPRAEADNAIPRTEDAAPAETAPTEPAQPAAPRGQPRDLKAELIQARKAESLLKSLLECLG